MNPPIAGISAGHPLDTPLATGGVAFDDPELSRLANTVGPLAAWTQLAGQPDPAQRLHGVRGEFSAAARGGPDQVLLAVDRFATHGMCYRVIDSVVHFGERADALAALEPRAAIDPQAIFDYLYFHVIPSPRTIFQGVYRLPPATLARCRRGRVEVTPYWAPEFTQARSADFTELSTTFRRLVQDAVATRLDGSKAACFLSGGTDSSTVAGMIGLATGRPAATFSIGFEAEGYDEMEYARIAAKRFGTEHHEYYVTPDDLVRAIPAVASHYDQPFGNSSVLPAYYCAKFAREAGVSRLLAGDGGDELFGGNARYAKQRLFGFYERVPAALRHGLIEPILLGSPVGRLPLASKAKSYAEQARVPLPDRMQMYNLLLRLGVGEVFEPGFLSQVDEQDPLHQQQAVWQQARNATALNRMLAFDWRYTLAEADVPKVRGSTALAGVDVAFPFLDSRLVDFSLGLPDAYKLRGQKLRWFFKEALRGFLPDEILTKKKQGFGLPFGVWATRDDGLRRFATDSLLSLAGRRIVQPAFVDKLLSQHLPAFPGYYGEMVWILMMLEQWLRHHAPNHRAG